MTTVTISNLEELQTFVKKVLANTTEASTTSASVLGLVGDLGVGKTAFTQLLARELGVSETVTSPTYLIMRSYATTHPGFDTLVHIDAYRIESLDELAPLRLAEVLAEPRTLVCIEWADRIKEALPSATRYFDFTLHPDGTRTIVF